MISNFTGPQLVHIKRSKAALLRTLSTRYRLLLRCNPEEGGIIAQSKLFRLRAVLEHLEAAVSDICIRESVLGIPKSAFMPEGFSNPAVAQRMAGFLTSIIQVQLAQQLHPEFSLEAATIDAGPVFVDNPT